MTYDVILGEEIYCFPFILTHSSFIFVAADAGSVVVNFYQNRIDLIVFEYYSLFSLRKADKFVNDEYNKVYSETYQLPS